VRRRAGPIIAATALCLTVGAAPAGAADRGHERLLNAYPLEQRPATVANANTAAPAPGHRRAPAPPADASSPTPPRLSQGAAIGVAAAAMLLAALVVVRRPRSAAAMRFAAAGAVAEPVAPPPPDPPPPLEDAPETRGRPPAALSMREAGRGVLCQVHWRCDQQGSWFEAVTVHDRGRATVAESPDFAWYGAAPPDRTPDATAALDALAGDLVAAGWRPVRGRGRAHGAPRWYARRYHLPALGPEPRPPDEPMDPVEEGPE
jgi:hypothetical protein